MRCDQFMGLPPDADQFLHEHAIKPKRCVACNQVIPPKLEVIEWYGGMFGEQFPLHRIPLKGGGYAEEFLQASPWSSGPIFFHGLRVYARGTGTLVTTFTWPDEELDNA